ncbi:uncharacterized protein NPIL_302671, partial [Nephila pilipes]
MVYLFVDRQANQIVSVLTFVTTLPLQMTPRMEYLSKFLILLCIFVNVETNEEVSGKNTTNSTRLKRKGRENYGPYPPTKVNDNFGEYEEETFIHPEVITYNGKPSQGNDYFNSDQYKSDPYSDYNSPSYPSLSNNYKGYPFYPSRYPSPNAQQALSMMALVNKKGATTKPEGTGLLSKFIADPNTAAAAIIPLSIAAAAVVPVLMNLIMGGTPTPMISTTANNKRSVDVSRSVDDLMN